LTLAIPLIVKGILSQTERLLSPNLSSILWIGEINQITSIILNNYLGFTAMMLILSIVVDLIKASYRKSFRKGPHLSKYKKMGIFSRDFFYLYLQVDDMLYRYIWELSAHVTAGSTTK